MFTGLSGLISLTHPHALQFLYCRSPYTHMPRAKRPLKEHSWRWSLVRSKDRPRGFQVLTSPYWDVNRQFYSLALLFPTFIHPQITKIPPFSHLWFLLSTPHKKCCAIPKWSSPASRNISYILSQQNPWVRKVISITSPIDLIWMGFMPGEWGWLQGVEKASLPQVFNLASWLSLCSCAPLILWWWTFSGLMAFLWCDQELSGRAIIFPVPSSILPLSLCSSLCVCRWAFTA